MKLTEEKRDTVPVLLGAARVSLGLIWDRTLALAVTGWPLNGLSHCTTDIKTQFHLNYVHRFSPDHLFHYTNKMAVCSQIHTKHINTCTVWAERRVVEC